MIMRMRKLSRVPQDLGQGLCRSQDFQRFTAESPCYRVASIFATKRSTARRARWAIEALRRSVRGNVRCLNGLGKSSSPKPGMVVGRVGIRGALTGPVE